MRPVSRLCSVGKPLVEGEEAGSCRGQDGLWWNRLERGQPVRTRCSMCQERKVWAARSWWAVLGGDVKWLTVGEGNITQHSAAWPSCLARGQAASNSHCQ